MYQKLIEIIFLLNLMTMFLVVNCQLINSDQSLKKLLGNSNYTKTTPPFYENYESVLVNISLMYFHLITLDEKNQIMTSLSVIEQIWHDPRLEWDPSMYGNLTKTNLLVNDIWRPTTAVSNSASGDGFLTTNKENSYATIYNTGKVTLYSQATSLQTRCELNVAKFPFDSQSCNISFTHWPLLTNEMPQIIYIFNNKTTEYSRLEQNHSIWDLVNISYLHEGFNGYIVMLQFQRKTTYYIMNLIIPCIILNIVILIAFFLPFASQLDISKSFF